MTETKANERQVGGSHYKKGDGDQHWDIVDRYNIPYLEGVGSKYPLRWREKGGIEDLEKTLHYIDKILESSDDHPRWQRAGKASAQLIQDSVNLCARHNAGPIEIGVALALLQGVTRPFLVEHRSRLANYIAILPKEQVL